jgi:hypothetical protein
VPHTAKPSSGSPRAGRRRVPTCPRGRSEGVVEPDDLVQEVIEGIDDVAPVEERTPTPSRVVRGTIDEFGAVAGCDCENCRDLREEIVDEDEEEYEGDEEPLF